MNKIVLALLSVISIFIGISLIMFVFRMVFFTPSDMGMMMGPTMMLHHMGIWLRGTFLLVIFFVIILLLVWIVKK